MAGAAAAPTPSTRTKRRGSSALPQARPVHIWDADFCGCGSQAGFDLCMTRDVRCERRARKWFHVANAAADTRRKPEVTALHKAGAAVLGPMWSQEDLTCTASTSQMGTQERMHARSSSASTRLPPTLEDIEARHEKHTQASSAQGHGDFSRDRGGS